MQTAVARTPQRRDVVAAATLGEAAALGEVRAGEQGVDETRDLVRFGRSVGVEHDDDVTGGGLEAAGQCIALALAGLLDDADVTTDLTSGIDGAVDGSAVDQNEFVVV